MPTLWHRTATALGRRGLPLTLVRLAATAWAVLIFALSEVRDPSVPSGFATPGHAALYFVLGTLIYLSLPEVAPAGRRLVIAILIASVYGASDEFHQSFVPGRMPDVGDWLTDTIGASVGAVTSAWLFRRSVRD